MMQLASTSTDRIVTGRIARALLWVASLRGIRLSGVTRRGFADAPNFQDARTP
jgi:hypothetical protein